MFLNLQMCFSINRTFTHVPVTQCSPPSSLSPRPASSSSPPSVPFYLDSSKNTTAAMSGALMTLCEQALSDRGKEKRAFNRTKLSAESGSGRGGHLGVKGGFLSSSAQLKTPSLTPMILNFDTYSAAQHLPC